MRASRRNVRFTPESGHQNSARVTLGKQLRQLGDVRRDPTRLGRTYAGHGFNLHLAFDFLDQNQRWLARRAC
jgi:hypothetical protein